MKDKFIEYHISDHLENIFKEAKIVLDTNALLNLYRYSTDTRSKYLEILSEVQERLSLTHHVCSEFYKNRYKLIGNRSVFKVVFKELIDSHYQKLLNIIKNSNGETKYSSALGILKHEDDLRDKVITEIEQSLQNLNDHIDSFEQDIDFHFIQDKDPILSEVVKIFKDKITDEILSEEKKAIYKEGEERYKKQIPPGYKDIDKGEPDKYGDLIIWKELENLSKVSKQDILFVSDDRKEDWAMSFQGKDLGPRKELIQEFYEKTGQLFYSITTKQFIKIISEQYSVEGTESLEKETEIIHEKFKNEKTTSRFLSDGNREKIQEYYSRRMADPREDWIRAQDNVNRGVVNLGDDWQKRQELLTGRIATAPEEWLKTHDGLNRGVVNLGDDWQKRQELLTGRMATAPEVWLKTHDDLNREVFNLDADWQKRQELLTGRIATGPEEWLKTQDDLYQGIIKSEGKLTSSNVKLTEKQKKKNKPKPKKKKE